MIHKEFDFYKHNIKFFGQYWQANTTQAVIILLHGMGEHSTRYAEFVIPELLKNDMSVVTFDQFGHGKTIGKRGHNPGFESVLDCVEIVITKTKSIFGDIPVFLYGHSMGGNVVINYVLKRKNNVNGVIATSPFLKLAFQPPSWKIWLGNILQKIAPSFTLRSDLDVTALSRDKDEVQKYINDPLVHDKISPNYSLTFIKTGKWAINNAEKLLLPVLLLHGTGDRWTSHEASKEFALNNSQITLKLVKNGYHELHNDLCKKEIMHTIVQWIELQFKKKRKS